LKGEIRTNLPVLALAKYWAAQGDCSASTPAIFWDCLAKHPSEMTLVSPIPLMGTDVDKNSFSGPR